MSQLFANVAASLFDQPWAITSEKLRELVFVFDRRRAGIDAAGPDMEAERAKSRLIRANAIGAKLRDVAGMTVDQVGRCWRRSKSAAPRREDGGGGIVKRTTVHCCELR